MGLIINGNEPNKILYNGAEVSLYFNGSKIWPNAAPVLDEVTIGTQTWKTKNLAVDDGQGGIYTGSVTYDGINYITEYYYDHSAAVRVANSVDGWHLPTKDEFDTLNSTIGNDAGLKLKSTYGWISGGNGTDDYYFAAFPAGYTTKGNIYSTGKLGRFWSSKMKGLGSTQYYIASFSYTGNTMSVVDENQGRGLSVRLIKDS